jgi:hypothetical protein
MDEEKQGAKRQLSQQMAAEIRVMTMEKKPNNRNIQERRVHPLPPSVQFRFIDVCEFALGR